MELKTDRYYQWAFYGLLAFHLVIWLPLGMALDIHPDEADHWVWSRFLSWGYYEHPPMIAWVIRLFTSLLGNNQWAMEIGSQTITLLSFLALFLLAKRQFGVKAAFFSVLTLEATPLFLIGSLIFIIDTVLLLFYLWAAYYFWKGVEEGDKKSLTWAGLALGLALLSKVTAILFPLSCLIFLLFSPKRRKCLVQPRLYLALLLSLIVFSPFIFWNMTHEWVSLRTQLEKGLTGGKDWNQMAGFWFGQPVILGPVLFFFLLKSLLAGIKERSRDGRLAYLVTLTLVPLVVFGLASFKGKYTDPTWTDIGWPFGAILLGRYFSERISKNSLKKIVLIGGLIFVSGWLPIGLVALHTFRPFLPLGKINDRTLEMVGWRQLGQAAGKEVERYFPGRGKVYVLADDYQLAGAVSFYTPQHPIPYSFSKSQRNFWLSIPELKKQGALLVCSPGTCQQDQQKASIIFHTVQPIAEIPILRQGQIVKKYFLFYCSN